MPLKNTSKLWRTWSLALPVHNFLNHLHFFKVGCWYGNLMLPAEYILDLYCVWLSNAAPFCKNYTKVYFNAKHKIFVALFFKKKYPFWPTSNAATNFWNMPWQEVFSDKVTPDIDFIDEAVVQCYVSVVKILFHVLVIYKWSQVNFDLNTYRGLMFCFWDQFCV